MAPDHDTALVTSIFGATPTAASVIAKVEPTGTDNVQTSDAALTVPKVLDPAHPTADTAIVSASLASVARDASQPAAGITHDIVADVTTAVSATPNPSGLSHGDSTDTSSAAARGASIIEASGVTVNAGDLHTAAGSSAPAVSASDAAASNDLATAASSEGKSAPSATASLASAMTTSGAAASPSAIHGVTAVSSAVSTDTAVEHGNALSTIAALVSPTNTVSKAVSISLSSDKLLDEAQLRIIDLFLSSTPDVKFRTVDNALEIYDPAAFSEPNVHPYSWDVGGGAVVRIIGISDAHALG